MVRRVLIAPVGYYEERLLSSILFVSPEKLYLIKGSDEYANVTKEIVKSLRTRLPRFLEVDDKRCVDFHNISEIYENFVEIIRKESVGGNTEIFVDVTSAPKSATIAATHLGQLFDIGITYTGPSEKSKETKDTKGFLDKNEDARYDPGIKPQSYKTHHNPLEPEEENVLLYLWEKKKYDSINDLIRDLNKTRKSKNQSDVAIQRYWSRIINRLESYQLLDTTEIDGKKKKICLTDIGSGLADGLYKTHKKS